MPLTKEEVEVVTKLAKSNMEIYDLAIGDCIKEIKSKRKTEFTKAEVVAILESKKMNFK